MALTVQQSPESILHRSGHRGENVGFHGGQVNNILALEDFRYLNALRENIVQYQHLCLRAVIYPAVWRCIQMNHRQVITVLHRLMLILFLSLEGIHHHRAVVGADQVLVAQVM